MKNEEKKKEVERTDTYSNASSEPVPLLFAVNNTQNTLHHLKKEKEKKKYVRQG